MQNQHSQICFIINPAANRTRALQNIGRLRQEASKLWNAYEIVIAEPGESLADLARLKSNSFDVIVACGGDGTISQIVNGLALTDTSLGLLPIGSGNDFLKSLDLKKTLPECLSIIHQNHTTHIDLIRYEDDVKGWCANTLGIGIDGWANYYAHQTSWMKGRIRYYYGALMAILTFRGCQMQLGSEKYSADNTLVMATFCNGKWEGGSFLVAPSADMKDGKLNLLTISKIPLLLLIIYLLRFQWGPAKWMKGITQLETESIEVSTSIPLAVHRDGEHLGSNIQHLKLSIEQKALQVIVPKDY